MDVYDRKKAARVWKRVQTTLPVTAPASEPDGLAAFASTARAAYLHLAQHGLPQDASTLKKLAERKQSQIHCLNGMRQLTAGSNRLPSAARIPGNTPLAILRRCYTSEATALREYELRIADRNFGPVYSELAAEQRQLCRMLLELIGRLEG